MRSRRTDDDSLDMLLDTVANMFGGIMFIAMLVAIMTGAGGLFGGLASDAMRSEVFEVLRLESDVRELSASVASLERAVEAGQTESAEEDPLVTDIAEARVRLVEAQARLEAAENRRESLRERAGELSDSAADVEAEALRLQEEEQEIAAEIQAIRDSRVTEARLPITRRTNKGPKHLILSRGRIFEIYEGDGQDYSRPMNQDVSLSRSGQVDQVSMRATGGFPVDASLSKHPRWRNMINSLDSGRHYFQIGVYPDSYEEFILVKQAVLEAGFEYGLKLFPTGFVLYVAPGEQETQ